MASGKKRPRLTFSAEEVADLCSKTISKDESMSESDPSGMLSNELMSNYSKNPTQLSYLAHNVGFTPDR